MGLIRKARRRLVARISGVFILGFCCPQVLYGQCGATGMHRPIEDLFASDVVYPQERGEAQIEVKRAAETDPDEHKPPFVLTTEYGLTNSWQLGAQWDRTRRTVRVGSKVAFRCLHGLPYRLAIGAESEFEGTGRVQIEPNVILARDFANRAHVFTSWSAAARVARGSEPGERWAFAADSGIAVRVAPGIRFTTELPFNGGPNVPVAVQIIPGVLWHWDDRIEVGAGALLRATRDADHGVLMHIVCEVGGEHAKTSGQARSRFDARKRVDQ